MNVSQKLGLIDEIGRELQSRYTFMEIDVYLKEFGVVPPETIEVNSKWVYSKTALAGTDTQKLLDMASDLGLELTSTTHQKLSKSTPPRIWENSNKFRLFISHLALNKDKATRLKEALFDHDVSGFVAHEDIEPTLSWQQEIERGLYTMDAMVAIHTPGFKNSFWTQQEIGFALGRNIKVVSLRMGEDPTGFISSWQALSRKRRNADEISLEILKLLKSDDRTSHKLLSAQGQAHKTNEGIRF